MSTDSAAMARLKAVHHTLRLAVNNIMETMEEAQLAYEAVLEEAACAKDNADQDIISRREKIEEERHKLHEEISLERKTLDNTRQALEERLSEARSKAEAARHVVKLNVGGSEFTTTKATLLAEPDTFFHAMLHSGSWTPDCGEAFFVDRSPKFFHEILDYLRDRKLYLQVEQLSEEERDRFVADLEFYQIGSLLRRLGEHDIGGTISTLAGTGKQSYSGDGGAASLAGINQPFGICFHNGRLFVAESCRVRAVYIQNGIIGTVAGGSRPGSDGDGGLAVAARLTTPNRVAAADDKLYITDFRANCVRVVDLQSGIINTLSGTGTEGYKGDGGMAVEAQLFGPSGIAVNGGKVYIADNSNHCVRVVDLSTGIINTLVGNGRFGYSGDGGPIAAAQLNSPNDLLIHHSKLYISDYGNHCVRVVDLLSGTISTIAGCGRQGYYGDGGPARNAQLSGPCGLAIHHGKLYIVDALNHCVRSVDLVSGTITTFCGNGRSGFSGDGGPPPQAQLAHPIGIDVSTSHMFIGDKDNCRIRMIG
eukprot:TRINITY_DN33735_c0_g1_i1.p1 TRINITY_DN33735_c0_g1~~TRINITY_DN33735_c0_g1_i1.p1  ORF type:complete len:535 (-),score=38.40 TRINITY_DN33735_c0_g1_i1:128-1732(-)